MPANGQLLNIKQIIKKISEDNKYDFIPTDSGIHILFDKYKIHPRDTNHEWMQYYFWAWQVWQCIDDHTDELKRIEYSLVPDWKKILKKYNIEATKKIEPYKPAYYKVGHKYNPFTDLPDESIELLKGDDVFYNGGKEIDERLINAIASLLEAESLQRRQLRK